MELGLRACLMLSARASDSLSYLLGAQNPANVPETGTLRPESLPYAALNFTEPKSSSKFGRGTSTRERPKSATWMAQNCQNQHEDIGFSGEGLPSGHPPNASSSRSSQTQD